MHATVSCPYCHTVITTTNGNATCKGCKAQLRIDLRTSTITSSKPGTKK